MNHTIKTCCLVLLACMTSNSYSIPDSTQRIRACTFHDEIYDYVQVEETCPMNLEVFDISLANGNTSGQVLHDKTKPHNPECFSSHIVVR